MRVQKAEGRGDWREQREGRADRGRRGIAESLGGRGVGD